MTIIKYTTKNDNSNDNSNHNDNNNIIPGHALHEKCLQRQKGVVPLVGSQEQRALIAPLVNR